MKKMNIKIETSDNPYSNSQHSQSCVQQIQKQRSAETYDIRQYLPVNVQNVVYKKPPVYPTGYISPRASDRQIYQFQSQT